jgi:signal transduction histidine kinase
MAACARVLPCLIGACLAIPTAGVFAQDILTLEQATSRIGADDLAANEGRSITVRGQVAGDPVWALDTYYLPLRDATNHGLILRADREQFNSLAPGDWIDATGTIQSRAGFPMLVPASIRPFKTGTHTERQRAPLEVSVADLNGLRYLGLVIRTSGTIDRVSDNLGGQTLELTDHGNSIAVFLPRAQAPRTHELHGLHAGQRVRLTGLATQYSLEPPHDDGFQVMLASPEAVEVISLGFALPPLVSLGVIAALGIIAWLWWFREHRLGSQRRSMRAFHTLSEEIIAAASPAEIAEKLVSVLPTVTQATAVRLYLYHRRTKSLERVPTRDHPEPMAVPLDSPPEGLVAGAVVCFKNRTLLNVPDVRRSPLVKITTKKNLPRSAMFLPLLAQQEVMGVLEVGNARRIGYFSVEEQSAAQHLANQVAASLKLQDQRTVREQLFRSEKLAATGQLISGVASELRAPIESILQLATSLTAYGGRAIPERDLRLLAGESQRASEIVSRLISFARPEDSSARPIDVNALVSGLMEFRGPEWRTLGLRVQNRLAAEPALVIGAQGQMEQVFLNLLVHAEQCAADAPGKTISAASTAIGGRVLVEISYAIPPRRDVDDPDAEFAPEFAVDPFATNLSDVASETGALGLGVCQGIIQSHGGEIRFRSRSGSAQFEVDLPLSRTSSDDASRDQAGATASTLTLMLVDADAAGQRQMMKVLSGRGHRVVPASLEEASDLAQRLRFDAVFWALRSSHGGSVRHSVDAQERVRTHVPGFVLVSDAYDPELARSMEMAGGFLIARPIQESQLNRILQKIELLSHQRQ